jgi:hypothetical protein
MPEQNTKIAEWNRNESPFSGGNGRGKSQTRCNGPEMRGAVFLAKGVLQSQKRIDRMNYIIDPT